MSLSLIVQEPDYIIISGDSRASRYKNGLQYAVDDDTEKLYVIDNNKIIFAGGNVWVAEQTIEKYKLSPDKSIENLNNIGKEVVNEFEIIYPDAASQFERKFEIVVACFENGRSVLYSLSSYEGYEIKRITGNESIVACIGTRRDEVLSLYNQFRYIMPPLAAYQAIYNSIANEEVGGSITVYILTKDGIQQKHNFKIRDKKPVRRYSEIEKTLLESSIGPDKGFVATSSDTP
jgi:hypothetical protein